MLQSHVTGIYHPHAHTELNCQTQEDQPIISCVESKGVWCGARRPIGVFCGMKWDSIDSEPAIIYVNILAEDLMVRLDTRYRVLTKYRRN